MGRNGPISVIQTLPVAAKSRGSSATVGQIRKPTTKPYQIARRGAGPPTMRQAPMYEAVIRTEPGAGGDRELQDRGERLDDREEDGRAEAEGDRGPEPVAVQANRLGDRLSDGALRRR